MKRKIMIIAAIAIATMNLTSCIVSEPRGGRATYYERQRGHHHHHHHGGGAEVIIR